MPLRDHFRPPLSEQKSWEGLHGGWPMVIVQQLVTRLPDGFDAEPRVHLGTEAEIDVATFNQDSASGLLTETDRGGVATAVWAPASPTLAIETDLDDFAEYEVRVHDVRRGRRLVAAIEIVSPANKDRPASRHQFVAKCAALLREGVSVALVDIVTSRSFNLYAELLEFIGEEDPALSETHSSTYAVACTWRPRDTSRWLETWNHPLTPGQSMPTDLPLWLTGQMAIPLDLDASYDQTCRDLRIP